MFLIENLPFAMVLLCFVLWFLLCSTLAFKNRGHHDCLLASGRFAGTMPIPIKLRSVLNGRQEVLEHINRDSLAFKEIDDDALGTGIRIGVGEEYTLILLPLLKGSSLSFPGR